jgi:hypothetical protein
MQRGRWHKAQRGALALPLPIGFERRLGREEIVLSSDQAVRHTISRVFALYAQLGSIRGVLRYFRQAQLELPHRIVVRGIGMSTGWHPASYDALYQILTNPLYAGVYTYGKRRTSFDPMTHDRHNTTVAAEEREVVIANHHPGYLSYAQYQENMARLHANRPTYQGAPREGRALLQGLAYCQHCGLRMRVRYHQPDAYYCCDRDHKRFAAPICCWASAKRVDALVEELVLGVITAGTLELSQDQERLLREEHTQRDRQWKEKLQRLEYACRLARTRYEMVDPANRLVAQTLETEWNTALTELEAAKAEYGRQQQPATLTSTLAQMREMTEQFATLWHGGTLEPQDKKELLRCLIDRVYLRREAKVIRAEVVWQGGARSELDVPKYLFTSSAIYHRVLDLAATQSDAEIAARLNAEGLKTVKGREWTSRRVMDFRLSNGIPSGLTASPTMRLSTSAYHTSAEVAAFLGLKQSAVQRWVAAGVLDGKHGSGQSQLWIHWTTELEHHLDGRVAFDPRMVSVRRLCREGGKPPEEVLRWARDQGHEIFRLRRGTAYRFYILPASAEHSGSR